MGKLKVGAARAWAESAGIICKKKGAFQLTPLGQIIAMHDPDLDEDGIWWLLHYNLAKSSSPAWFYSFYCNEFRQDSFSRDDFEKAVRAHWDDSHEKPMTDSVFHKLIFSPFKQVFEGTRLGEKFGFWLTVNNGNYLRQTENAPPLPKAILAYALLDWSVQQQQQTAHLEKFMGVGGVGRIFRLAREDLDNLLVDIGQYYQKKVAWISHAAGLNSVSIMNFSSIAMVSAYYYELDGKDPMDALARGEKEVEQVISQASPLCNKQGKETCYE